METEYSRLCKLQEIIRKHTDIKPHIALVLGSGLGTCHRQLRIEAKVPYQSLPDFPVSTVAGHEGAFLFGTVEEVPVVCMQGRVHLYEGYTPTQVALPIRLMGLLGAKALFLTNAAGGIREDLTPGDLLLIKDHIATFVPSPLTGVNEEALGERFPDMSEIYSRPLQEELRLAARACGVPLKEGVYLQFRGPQYETPAEIRLAKALGADVVGMSTAIEAVAAKHMHLAVCGISCITNLAAGIAEHPLSHAEVKETAQKTETAFARLVTAALIRIHNRLQPLF